MTVDGPTNSHGANPPDPTCNQQSQDNPRAAVSESVEGWLRQVSAELSSPPTASCKRKRSPTAGPPPYHTPLSRPRLLESSGSDSDPSQSDTVTPSMPSNPSKASLKTPSHVTIDNTKHKIPKDPAWVKERLREYRCFQDEPGALERYPEFKKHVLDIVDRKRHSKISVASAEKFTLRLNQNLDENEDTFLHNILPTIIKETRSVRTMKSGDAVSSGSVTGQGEDWEILSDAQGQGQHIQEQDGNPEERGNAIESSVEESEWVVADFAESGLIVKVNREFRGNFLPNNPNGSKPDTELAKAMAKVDGMKNPKPDRAFGIHIHRYPRPEDVTFSVEIQLLLEIIKLLHWACFVIEGKSDSGSMSEATNQACRSCAAIINASKCLLEEIGELAVSASGPDTRTFIFSATISPVAMKIWVHWAEYRPQQSTIFHMHKLKSVNLDDENAAGTLRKIIHNILDWGCGERVHGLKKTYDKIYDYERKRKRELSEGVLAEDVFLGDQDASEGDDTNAEGPSKRQRTGT